MIRTNKNVFIYWDSGFENAPEICRLCAASWVKFHEQSEWTVHLLDASRTVVKQLHSGKLDEGRHSFTQEVIETPAVFLKFETTGQKLERRLQ